MDIDTRRTSTDPLAVNFVVLLKGLKGIVSDYGDNCLYQAMLESSSLLFPSVLEKFTSHGRSSYSCHDDMSVASGRHS